MITSIMQMKQQVMQYNVCNTCGACDGRAGMLIDTQEGHGSECMNCYDTRRTGDMVLHAHLQRTQEEVDRTFAIVYNKL